MLGLVRGRSLHVLAVVRRRGAGCARARARALPAFLAATAPPFAPRARSYAEGSTISGQLYADSA